MTRLVLLLFVTASSALQLTTLSRSPVVAISRSDVRMTSTGSGWTKLTKKQLKSMTKKELKEHLMAAGMKVSGNKKSLIVRLDGALVEEALRLKGETAAEEALAASVPDNVPELEVEGEDDDARAAQNASEEAEALLLDAIAEEEALALKARLAQVMVTETAVHQEVEETVPAAVATFFDEPKSGSIAIEEVEMGAEEGAPEAAALDVPSLLGETAHTSPALLDASLKQPLLAAVVCTLAVGALALFGSDGLKTWLGVVE